MSHMLLGPLLLESVTANGPRRSYQSFVRHEESYVEQEFPLRFRTDGQFFGRAAHRIHCPKSTGHLSSTSTNAVRQPARWAGIKSRLLTGLIVMVVVAAASVVAIALFVR